MLTTISRLTIGLLSIAIIGSCSQQKTEEELEEEHPGNLPQTEKLTPVDNLEERLNIYAPFTLTSDIDHLTKEEKKILPILFDVADIMGDLFWEQTIGQKEEFLNRIENPQAKKFAKINYGPWDRLNNNKPFFKEIGPKPAGANFYPTDMDKEEFKNWENENKTSLYTLIRRDNKGNLKSVWYHEAYKSELEKASKLLKKAAKIAGKPSLKKYLNLRAKALLTSKYQKSDFAWMEMKDSNIDMVVGPIENYEDGLFGYKAAFESFILIKDPEWSKKLTRFTKMLPKLQQQLPVEQKYKKEVPGTKSDINVYDAVYYSGDCKAGSKTIAINLPNDEEVHVKYGTRKLMLKNAMKAKFEKILVPISDMLIDPDQRKYLTFNAFFENTMFHEVGHAMGIKETVNGKGPVRKALKEAYSPIEEGKADIMGLYIVTKLYEEGELTSGELMDNYVTFFASIFRSSRFGAASAHGKANMMRLNYFREHGAFTRNDDGTYTVNFEKMHEVMVNLLEKILHIQGNGEYEKARQWIDNQGVITPQLQNDLDRLNNSDVPVDVTFEQGKDNLDL
ncbi:MAG: Zn-dependent hydrolase [Bacteroidales bacterium]|nr:Zn-dependent hydrolase [Bacteroidales bacterium]MCF8334489.1 Zn-dependent hydrolase [Bacteroidales bacterium]